MFDNTKNIIVILVLLCAGIGYYAWRQQQKAFSELDYLKSSGVNIAFSLTTRPLLAVDRASQVLYLLSGKGEHTAKKIPLIQIAAIEFIETPVINAEQDEPRGPDTIRITMNDGTQYRVGDLQITAKQAKARFDEYHILKDKSLLKLRR